MNEAVWAVLVAAGGGKRFGNATPKQYLPLAGRSMLEHSLGLLLNEDLIAGVVVVLAGNDGRWPQLGIKSGKPLLQVTGGAERADSVCAGLRAVVAQAGAEGWALVHDAARPCLRIDVLRKFIEQLRDDPVGGLLAVPSHDSLKQVNDQERVSATVNRDRIWYAQTPQMFRAGALLRAYEAAAKAGVSPTDDAGAMEYVGHAPRVVQGHATNLKVTTPEDLQLAEHILWGKSQ
ncbi:MAG: 2-C-methyl-D-erythritol 4-phosphate cytidylyltransferase [Nevskiales bacterium]